MLLGDTYFSANFLVFSYCSLKTLAFSLLTSPPWSGQYSTGYFRGTLCKSLGFSLCVPFSSLVLCPVNSFCLGLPRLLSSSPWFWVSTGLYISVPSLCCISPGSTLCSHKATSSVSHQPEIAVLHFLISNVLKTIVSYILFGTFRCFRLEGKLACYSILTGSASHWFLFNVSN